MPRAVRTLQPGEELGQAMIEFALVLPVLALLTFGTLEVALYLQQQSSLNAAAYVAARSASVLGNTITIPREKTKAFADATGFGWLQQSVEGMKVPAGTHTSIALTTKTDQLTGILGSISSGGAAFSTLTGRMTLPLEYDGRKQGKGYDAKSKPRTISLVDYENEVTLGIPQPGITMAFEKLKSLRELFTKQDAAPTPAPTAPPAPKPQPSGAPAPAPVPVQPPFKLPAWSSIKALDTSGEPFLFLQKRGAVGPNPHKEDVHFAGLSSNKYVQPGFETMDLPEPAKIAESFSIQTRIKSLTQAEERLKTLNAQCVSIDEALKKVGVVAPVVAVINPVRKALGVAVGPLDQKAEQAYQKALRQEQQLFGR